jgi:SAM-dependent methyltransferase
MENEELKAIAAQLRQPHGSKGIQVSDMMHESNINMTRQTIKTLELSENEEVLELGHGNAGHLQYLFEIEKTVRYYGLEISELMHAEAKQINKSFADHKQAFFFMYDGMDMPFGNDYFDKGYTVNTLYFWEEPVKMLQEIYRVMKPEGIFSIGFAQKSFMEQLPFTQFGFTLYDTKTAEALVAKTDFNLVKSETQVEQIKGKIGGMLSREFTILTLKK